ncbi:MAG: EAL domain-containing protein [Pseudomonadales bacterium]
MFDIFLEITGCLIAAIILYTLLRGIKDPEVKAQPGSRLVVIGFGLLFFSLLIDITDNFPELDYLVVIGDTEYQAFLEKVVGTLLGLFFLALGFKRWIPSIQQLAHSRQSLDQQVKKRTKDLEQANVKLSIEVHERKKAQEHLKHLAIHDALTALPNRYAMTEFLEHEISRTSRHSYYSAVLFLDLDNFKSINDVQGHGTGDQVLKIVSERLDQCRRAEDFLGRFGGDEFVLILTELDADLQVAAELAQVAAQRIIKSLNEPILLANYKLMASCCIGIKLFPGTQEETCSDLLKQADMALYHAKDKGQGAVSFFYEDMQKLLEKRLELASELQEALEQEQFYLHYQPQVNTDAQVFGVEALLRWNHPTRGMVGPDEFIPIAEETGLINQLGRYVLHHTLSEWSKFLAEGVCESAMKVAVNISPSHFLEADFVDQIKHILSSYDLQNCHVVLEITEGVVIQDIADISAKMEALRQLGVGLSLDDFGTGYSSLAYLKRLPLDTLKIDRSFVRDIHLDPNDAAIVEAILAMAASLGIDVIAEGVETDAQRQFLEQRGCILYQGYLFSRPAPLNELVEKRVFEQLVKPLAVRKSI